MEFKPKYTISDLLLSNIKQITEIITELNTRRFSGVILTELEKRAREISAFSSTSIEGNPLPLTDVKRILQTRPEQIRDSEREVLNYNKALIELDSAIKSDKQMFHLDLILNIQKGVVDGLLEEYRLGRLRTEPVFVNNPRTRETVYLPPDHSDVPKLMTSLLRYTNESEGNIDPLIVAGIFHKQFVIIHPFIDGNGRTARLATKVLLAKMGVNTFSLFSFENYYNHNITRYFERVGEFGNYYDIQNDIDFTLWLEYFTSGIIDELLRVRKELDRTNTLQSPALREHHRDIIAYIKKHGSIRDVEYAKLTNRAKPTRNIDLRKLIELGLIEKCGAGKATYYRLR